MEEARAVLARLERIEALDRENAESRLVLAELRELVHEVEAWTKREGAALEEDRYLALATKGSNGGYELDHGPA